MGRNNTAGHNTSLWWDNNLLVNCNCGFEGICLTGDDLLSVLDDGLLNDVDGLHDDLLVLDLDGDLIGDLDWNFDDLGHLSGDGVWAGNVHNLLNDLMLVLNDGVRSVDGDWNGDRLVDESLHWVGDVTLNNLFNWNGHLNRVWLSDLIGSGDGSLNDLCDFADNGVGNGSVNDTRNVVGDFVGCRNLNLIGNVNIFLNNFDHWIRNRDVNNLLDCVRNGPLHYFGDSVWHLDMVTDSDLNWDRLDCS